MDLEVVESFEVFSAYGYASRMWVLILLTTHFLLTLSLGTGDSLCNKAVVEVKEKERNFKISTMKNRTPEGKVLIILKL